MFSLCMDLPEIVVQGSSLWRNAPLPKVIKGTSPFLYSVPVAWVQFVPLLSSDFCSVKIYLSRSLVTVKPPSKVMGMAFSARTP